MDYLDDQEKGWVETALPVLKDIMERREDGEEYPEDALRLINEEFSVPGDPQRYINLLKGLYDGLADPGRRWEYSLRPGDVTPEDVIHHLRSKALQTGKGLENDTTKAIYLMVRSAVTTWPWNQLVDSIDDKLQRLIVTGQDKSSSISDIAIGYFTGLIGTLLILAERQEHSRARNSLVEFARRGDLFIAIQQTRPHPPSYASSILSLLYLNRRPSGSDSSFDPFAEPTAYQSTTHQGASHRGRALYLDDIQTPELIDEVLPHVIELARQAGIVITEEMDHPDHNHSLLINALQEKMQDSDAIQESSEGT